MAALVIRQPMPRQSPTPPPQPNLGSKDLPRAGPTPIPNKHIPYCSPGPIPLYHARHTPATPPDSPPSKSSILEPSSLLYPVDRFTQVSSVPPVYSLSTSELAGAINHSASQLLPDPKHVFPWLHGLNAENQMQLAFFSVRRKVQRSTPRCYREITIVKADGDLSRARIKSAIAPDEILEHHQGLAAGPRFVDMDPREGFSIRNFQIQTSKMAAVSDIVIYRDETSTDDEVRELAKKFSCAQETRRLMSHGIENEHVPRYNTFILRESLTWAEDGFSSFERDYPELVAIDSEGTIDNNTVDLLRWERQEMCKMSEASEIARNVWLGPTPDTSLNLESSNINGRGYDIIIETTDVAQPPDKHTLKRIGQLSQSVPQHLEFPASGSMLSESCANPHTDPLVNMCRWMHRLANVNYQRDSSGEEEQDEDGDIPMKILQARPRRILIHCTDGYTETTLLGLAYFMYAEQIPLHTALMRLHCEKRRNFFAYPSDISVLSSVQPLLMRQMPLLSKRGRSSSLKTNNEPPWLARIDGSLPSRILPYMYLGNLTHANNPELLKAMGIGQILSVGEPVNWPRGQLDVWGRGNALSISDVQDNGVDALTKHFDRCLDFIARGASGPNPTATLVHCRVGVSRSATICIAAVMSALRLSFPRAYCYVRARRLNVIIQPHLRFAYELMKWDEVCQARRGEPARREIEWASVAREVGRLNAPYCSRQ